MVEAIYKGMADHPLTEFKSPRSFLVNVNDISYVDEANTTLHLRSRNIGFFVTEDSMGDLLDWVRSNE